MKEHRALLYALLVAGALYSGYTIVRDAQLDRQGFARPRASYVVTDRHGEVLRVVRPAGVDHAWVPLRDVSPHFLRAVIAAEDARFLSHEGVDVRSVARAAASPVLPGRRRSGASTIAQQVVKLTHRRSPTVRGKLVEIVRARTLVKERGHEAVLEEYVNRLPFGNHIVGVERASEVYFGKPASDLTLAEAAMLAGIPQAPSVTEPLRHAERARARQAYVLARLEALGVYDRVTLARARVSPVTARRDQRMYRAARFVDRVLEAPHPAEVTGTLRTSLDLALDTRVAALLREGATRAEALGVTNACGLVLDARTGEVLAYVGAALGGSAEGGSMDLVRRKRHPGSTLKPFAYASFFALGGAPVTLLEDEARGMTGALGRTYATENFEGHARGRVSARDALASSLNLAALDVARRVGPDALTRSLRDFGFGSVISAEEHGGAVVLGGVSVTPYELARAYLALARGGDRIEPSFVPTLALAGRRVADETGVLLVTDVLRDAEARAQGFGADLEALAGGPFALKTGTSPSFRDAWAAVYDERFVAVVWLGAPRGTPTRGATGFRVAAPLAARVLGAARGHDAVAVTPRPALASVALCTLTGERAGAHCPTRMERFATHPPSTICDGRHAAPAEASALRIVHPAEDATFYVRGASAPSLRVRVTGEGPFRMTLDGRVLTDGLVPLVPGPHTLVVRDARGQRMERRFRVREEEGASLLRVGPRDGVRVHAERGAQPVRGGRDVALRRREADVERARHLFERELLAVA